MASLIGGFFLAYLLSVSFTQEVQLNLSTIEKLVDYQYDFGSGSFIPSQPYNGSIRVYWAVPPSALQGIGAESITVRVTAASSQETVKFISGSAASPSQQAEILLRCDVENGVCKNTSSLSVSIPMVLGVSPQDAKEVAISLKSEIVEKGAAPQEAGQLLASLAGALGQNSSPQQNSSGQQSVQLPSLPQNLTNFSQAENFLDSLRPEGDSKNPVEYLKGNPLISITALLIVILITGAYLLNAKD
jgi:hypothetical protein